MQSNLLSTLSSLFFSLENNNKNKFSSSPHLQITKIGCLTRPGNPSLAQSLMEEADWVGPFLGTPRDYKAAGMSGAQGTPSHQGPR